jgi:hypothetical protein
MARQRDDVNVNIMTKGMMNHMSKPHPPSNEKLAECLQNHVVGECESPKNH